MFTYLMASFTSTSDLFDLSDLFSSLRTAVNQIKTGRRMSLWFLFVTSGEREESLQPPTVLQNLHYGQAAAQHRRAEGHDRVFHRPHHQNRRDVPGAGNPHRLVQMWLKVHLKSSQETNYSFLFIWSTKLEKNKAMDCFYTAIRPSIRIIDSNIKPQFLLFNTLFLNGCYAFVFSNMYLICHPLHLYLDRISTKQNRIKQKDFNR